MSEFFEFFTRFLPDLMLAQRLRFAHGEDWSGFVLSFSPLMRVSMAINSCVG
jgi:hypothetical protein